MSAARWQDHTVTVEVDPWPGYEGPRPVVKFTCTAPEDAPCRTYPVAAKGPAWDGCECEVFRECDDHGPREEGFCGLGDDAPTHDAAGHLFEPGQDCWVALWFDGTNAVYAGPDADDRRDDCVPAVERTGAVDIESLVDDGYIEWRWHAAGPEGA